MTTRERRERPRGAALGRTDGARGRGRRTGSRRAAVGHLPPNGSRAPRCRRGGARWARRTRGAGPGGRGGAHLDRRYLSSSGRRGMCGTLRVRAAPRDRACARAAPGSGLQTRWRGGGVSDRHLGGCSSGTAYGPGGWAGPGSAAVAAPAGPACPPLWRGTRAGPALPCGLSPLSLSQRSLESSEQEGTRCQQSPDHTAQSQRGRGSYSAQGTETRVTSP